MSKTSENLQYSRMRSGLKVFLPIFAGMLVLGMLIYPNLDTEETGFTLSFEDAISEDGVIEMINPRFVGVDALGRPYTISATRAVQERQKEGQTRLSDISADITLNSGVWITLSAAAGELSDDNQQLVLEGPIKIFTDLGYEFQTGQLTVNLKQGHAETTSGVTGQGPAGTLEANSMEVQRNGDWLKFGNGIKVVVYPNEMMGSD